MASLARPYRTRLGSAAARGAIAGDLAALAPRAAATFETALISGSDERLVFDPLTGRTKYGTPRGRADDEIWFSSSTASAVSPRGYVAASALWQNLLAGGVTLDEGFESIRRRLARIFGIAGSEVILAGSGTEATLISLAVARMCCAPRLTALIVGCAETGRGVAAAAAGLHFVRRAAFADVAAGARLSGLEDLNINVDTVAIRDRNGRLRPHAEIDDELARKVEAARRNGRDVVIHRVEASKTGQSAPTLDALAALATAEGDHVLVLADACQLRSSAAQIQNLLRRGFLVSITGSKFAGGPPFAGALLVPPAVAARMRPRVLPDGFSAYSARLDWPQKWRGFAAPGVLTPANIGLLLRWQAALAEIDCFTAWEPDLVSAIFAHFAQQVAQFAAESDALSLLPSAHSSEGFGHTICCIGMRHRSEAFFNMDEAAAVQNRLRARRHFGTCFHVGQPVAVGGVGALRVSLSAPLTNQIAAKTAAGCDLTEAFAPVSENLRRLFAAWSMAMAPSTAEAGAPAL